MHAPQGLKRGYGACNKCTKQYSNRNKSKYCECGNLLGGKFVKKTLEKRYEPLSVRIYDSDDCGLLVSHKCTPKGDRQFLYYSSNRAERICYSMQCIDLRMTHVTSGNIDEFHCKHMLPESELDNPIYRRSFSENEICNFIPDTSMWTELNEVQDPNLPTVVKLSDSTYAVIGTVSAGTLMKYTHVRLSTGNKPSWYCTNKECSKKSRRTDEVHVGKKVCLHLKFLQLAKHLEDNVSDDIGCLSNACSSVTEGTASMVEVYQNEEDTISPDNVTKKTIEVQMQRKIPFEIPPDIVSLSDRFVFYDNLQSFEPHETVCFLCGSNLSKGMNQQGSQSGFLLTNRNPFLKIHIKMKKCLNKDHCGASHMLFPYTSGLFNACNKVLVGLDILLEWREFLKDGMPLSNIISRKLNALLLKTDLSQRPNANEVEYLVKVLYDGFYGFESMTLRNLNDVICGYCGIVGRVMFGESNEKNCCSLRDVISNDGNETPRIPGETDNNETENDKLKTMVDKLRFYLLERCTFSKSKYSFKIGMGELSPLIPSAMRKAEVNTEHEKKSIYLKKSSETKGDAILLSKLLKDMKLSINHLDDICDDELKHIGQYCKIPVSGKSMDKLKAEIRSLYASVLVGRSSCHQFAKLPGHTGGLYDFICPHGTTVCSKFMAQMETVRDAADLWLSLKHPPVIFMCDTPCIFVRHMNARCPAEAEEYWGQYDGCFEIPDVDKIPTKGQNVPSIVQTAFANEEEIPKEYGIFEHPLTGKKQRYICGDGFHSKVDSHKSPLCSFHDIGLCKQAPTVKTSYPESLIIKKNKRRIRSASTQDILHHVFYNYLMNYYDNQEIVMKQKYALQKESGKLLTRDPFMRFVFSK